MRILVDENIPLMTVAALRGNGHDVLDVRGTREQGSDDSTLWQIAQGEERLLRVVWPAGDKLKRHGKQPRRNTMEDPQARITIDPDVCNGKPTIRGKRITVETVLDFLSAGESRERDPAPVPFPAGRRHRSVPGLRHGSHEPSLRHQGSGLKCPGT